MLNLTPHDVTVLSSDGSSVVFPASGMVARVSMTTHPIGTVDGAPIVKAQFGEAILPDVGEEKRLIVSTMFAEAFLASHSETEFELYVPDSGPSAIREVGQIKAVRALIRK
jgi:hypothetical protein